MIHRLFVMETPEAMRNDRWNCDVGFETKGTGGISQMVCRDNLFVSITVWTGDAEKAGDNEDTDRVLNDIWNSFM